MTDSIASFDGIEALADRVPAGKLPLDRVTMGGALNRIQALVEAKRGGYVVTPNVDHVVQAEHSPVLRRAVVGASLSLADGMPLVWMSRLLGNSLPEKVSGSDLVPPLMQRAADHGWGVYFLGAAPGVGQRAADILQRQIGLKIAGVAAPPVGFDTNPSQAKEVVDRVRAAAPELVLVALGCPKQECWMHRHREAIGSAVALGIGATLDFIAGKQKRAPRWMSRAGLEWLYRLAREPRRMFGRYILRDPEIVRILAGMLRDAETGVRPTHSTPPQTAHGSIRAWSRPQQACTPRRRCDH